MLARFWGIALIALCVPFLLNKRIYTRLTEKIASEEMVFLYSLVAVIVGAFSVAMLTSWTIDYKGFITLLGWSSLLKGFFGLLLPKYSIELIDRFGKYRSLIFFLLVLFFILGTWLLFLGLIR